MANGWETASKHRVSSLSTAQRHARFQIRANFSRSPEVGACLGSSEAFERHKLPLTVEVPAPAGLRTEEAFDRRSDNVDDDNDLVTEKIVTR